MRAEIAQTAEQFALATVEANQLAEAQDKIRQNAEEMAEFQKSLTHGMVDGFLQGKRAADVFADALSKISDRLLNMAFDGLFDSKGGGGLLGGIGKIFGFADGGYTGSGGVNQPAGVVHNGEVVWSQKDVARAGGVAAVEAMRRGIRGYAAGGAVAMPALKAPTMPVLKAPAGNDSGSTVVNFAPVINAPNADKEGLARVEQQMAKMQREIPSTVIQTIREVNKRGVKY